MGLDDYKVVLYRQDDGSWVAEIPALGGCYALMDTREAALAELEVERYIPIDNDHLNCEATIEDPKVCTRPWKISMPLYRRVESPAQLGECLCVEFASELLYAQYSKQEGSDSLTR